MLASVPAQNVGVFYTVHCDNGIVQHFVFLHLI